MHNFTPVPALAGGVLIGLAALWLLAAGFAWQALGEAPAPLESPGLAWMAAAGLLVGFGTRVSGGCTSGHGVCGLGRFSLRSLVAVIVFITSGMASVFVARHLLGA